MDRAEVWELAVCKALSQHPFCVSFADERDRVQKKTFTKWVNKHLMKVRFFPVSLAFLTLHACVTRVGSYTRETRAPCQKSFLIDLPFSH